MKVSGELLVGIEESCRVSGYKLTAKRKKVLALLSHPNVSLSAYELARQYKLYYEETISTMSVYRILEFFLRNNLVHKLNSTNKYILCSDSGGHAHHRLCQFLICHRCNNVYETSIKDNIVRQLKDNAGVRGFQIDDRQLELHGLCGHCQH
jgi:Fur family zinc uptake transcriptional regulator